VLATGALALAGCFALALRGGIRPPAVHDEFSYILAADTFVHGRLTNPPPPAWKHFEVEHIIVHPTYMSKYPPAQALFLAVGQAVRQPILGVWLGITLGCAAVTWMLLAWVPLNWALIGGLIAVSRFVLLADDGWWSQRYWGGGVALLGGALLVGAWRRLGERAVPRDALVLAMGLLILANSRPFEGAVISLPIVLDLLWRARSDPRSDLRDPPVLRAVLLPLAFGAFLMGYYNHRVTGHFWLLPHLAYQHQYTASPQFLWLSPGKTPAFGNKEMARLHVAHELNRYWELRRPERWLADLGSRWSAFWRFFLGFPLEGALVALPWALRDGWTRRAFGVLLWLLLGLASLTWFFPHYAAPAGGIVILLVVESLRKLSEVRFLRWPIRRLVTPIVVVVLLLQVGELLSRYHPADDWSVTRQALQNQLEHEPGKQLVLVRYSDAHNPNVEWIYNGADLPDEPVIWARSLGTLPDHELTKAFADRKVWVLDVDVPTPTPVPFIDPG
jgi:hypothetical protein